MTDLEKDITGYKEMAIKYISQPDVGDIIIFAKRQDGHIFKSINCSSDFLLYAVESIYKTIQRDQLQKKDGGV